LHGFPQFADASIDMMHGIAAVGLRALAFDQRGYSPGARPPAIEDYDLVHLTSDVLAFADQAGASKFHLGGHDWGGFLAWKLAAEHPETSWFALRTLHTARGCFFEAARSEVKVHPQYVSAPYRFELLKGYSHWLLEEAPRQIAEFVLSHIDAHPLDANSRK
jgi:hypothetical protein